MYFGMMYEMRCDPFWYNKNGNDNDKTMLLMFKGDELAFPCL